MLTACGRQAVTVLRSVSMFGIGEEDSREALNPKPGLRIQLELA